ncbi:MAG: phosphoribulokinase [Gallionellaceae bacterium]|nr:phosphoribulokinase [Gallionellaceae bacterium]MDD5366234.1 phosphoribulokinase [Gallionellaceae bacterium]
MSVKHPIVAVTGSSGSGLSFVRHAFKDIFFRLRIKPALIHGDAFRRYTESQFTALLDEARNSQRHISWFGPECNYLAELEALFRTYGTTGNGIARDYAHNDDHAKELKVQVGEFTSWHPLPEQSDILLYEGQHGGVKADTWTRRQESFEFPPDIDRRKNAVGIDVAQHVDLLIGIVPAINLEWIQKIHRDCEKYHCSREESVETILRRLDDYIHYIVPQFGLTDINIQRIPLVDTSNPFIARDVPAPDESALVIHFRDRKRHDFRDIMKRIPGSRMTRASTLLVPGGKLRLALSVICAPILEDMMTKRREALKA